MNELENPKNLELVDFWIDAIPEDNYSPCPCGCGKKFKFVKDNLQEHEEQFYRNILTMNKISDTVCIS